MSHYLVELYTPNSAWRALPADSRQQFLDGIQTAMGGLSFLALEAIGATITLAYGFSSAAWAIEVMGEYRFLGIWRFPDLQARDALLAGIKASGWYDYFDHVNAACNAGGFEHHLAALAAG